MIQILGFLGMYFDAVVVEVKTFFNFIHIGSLAYENNLILESPTKTSLVTFTNVMHGQSHLPFGVILKHKTIVHYVPLSFSFFSLCFS